MPNPSQKPWRATARIGALSTPSILLALTLLTGCLPISRSANAGGATEATLCRIWGEGLPTRSHSDTAQTQGEIGDAYADYAAACPDHRNLIP